MTIESFEVSESDEYGDLLNKYEKKEKLKIGLYTSAYFEYYRMYPKTLEGAFMRLHKIDPFFPIETIKLQPAQDARLLPSAKTKQLHKVAECCLTLRHVCSLKPRKLVSLMGTPPALKAQKAGEGRHLHSL